MFRVTCIYPCKTLIRPKKSHIWRDFTKSCRITKSLQNTPKLLLFCQLYKCPAIVSVYESVIRYVQLREELQKFHYFSFPLTSGGGQRESTAGVRNFPATIIDTHSPMRILSSHLESATLATAVRPNKSRT